ncbi:transposase [Candidatus Peregrinibacteria bacterium CG10_big_fil_rev_8_21_14_0_10_42_8]|nr:MAG: transposase [Candidatus Peregrinibacteria bacterium CG10_big_fil_rev_8_21_14_0_10_42_8]
MIFQGKYRIETTRLVGRDYSQPGKYFVTICTKSRAHWFGEIRNDIMGLSEIGCIVACEIQKTSLIRKNVCIDSWIVMPNHIHMIIVIGHNNDYDVVETSRRDVSTLVQQTVSLFRQRPQSLGSIIQQMKCVCTKRIHTMGHIDFGWQPRFHDHIIRNNHSLNSIRSYISNNPKIWNQDRNGIGTGVTA